MQKGKKMTKIKDTSYYTVQGWMLTQLHLKGNALQVFAIIHGFSHSENNEFSGSLQYLCEFTGASRSTVIRSLSELQCLGLIVKREIYENGVKFNRYKAVENITVSHDTPRVKMTLPPCQNDTTPRVNMTPHNIDNKNIEDNIESTRKRVSHTAYGEYGWVKLSEEEHTRLINEYGEAEVQRAITYVDESAQSNGNKNRWKDWNLVLRKCIRNGWGKSGGNNGTNEHKRDYEPSQLNVTRL